MFIKNKRGFTLIELLTVIAILGILVLLAAPKFLGYTEKANIAKIQTGIKAVETAVDLKSLEDPEFTADLVAITPDKLQEINDSGKLIDKNGFIKEDLEGGKNVPLKDLDNVKWRSGGEFIVNPEDDSVYYYNKDMNVSKNPDGSATTPGDNNGGDNSPAEPEGPNYPIELPNGDFEQEDGTITTVDGGIRQPDGSVKYPDTDGDGWSDKEEADNNTDPLDPNSKPSIAIDENSDGITDGWDTDGDGKVDIINFDPVLALGLWSNIYQKVYPERQSFYSEFNTNESRLKFVEENLMTVEQAKLVEDSDVINLQDIEHLNGVQYLINLSGTRWAPLMSNSVIDTSANFWQPLVELAEKSTKLTTFTMYGLTKTDADAIALHLNKKFNVLDDIAGLYSNSYETQYYSKTQLNK